MRAIRSSSMFPFFALPLLTVALALGGCSDPVPMGSDAGDANVGIDTGSTMRDMGPPVDAFVRPDTGPIPLCTGTGCDLVGIELMVASTCVIRANGQVDCWGRAQDGELGDGLRGHSDNCRRDIGEANTDCSRDAVTVALPSAAESITSRGSIQACALLAGSHETWCWGGQFYRLGSNLEHSRFAPEHVAIAGTPIADGATGLATTFSNLCWVAADTTVQCIGSGGSGRLGDGTFNDTSMPTTVVLSDGTTQLTGVLEVETSGGHSCARTATHLYCWGNNQNRQLGSAPPHQTCMSGLTPYDCTNTAIEVTGVDATTVTDIELGGPFSCVLHSTGHVECWGGGQTGGLGTGLLNATITPVEPTGLTNVDELRVVGGNACALRHDGTVWCWGPANLGQIGDGSMVHDPTPCVDDSGAPYDCQLTPVQVMGLTGVEHIGLGGDHACALTTTDEVWCWGESLRYQLGNMMRPDPVFAPVRATALGM